MERSGETNGVRTMAAGEAVAGAETQRRRGRSRRWSGASCDRARSLQTRSAKLLVLVLLFFLDVDEDDELFVVLKFVRLLSSVLALFVRSGAACSSGSVCSFWFCSFSDGGSIMRVTGL